MTTVALCEDEERATITTKLLKDDVLLTQVAKRDVTHASVNYGMALRERRLRSLSLTRMSVRNCMSSRIIVSGDAKGRIFSVALGDAYNGSEEVFE